MIRTARLSTAPSTNRPVRSPTAVHAAHSCCGTQVYSKRETVRQEVTDKLQIPLGVPQQYLLCSTLFAPRISQRSASCNCDLLRMCTLQKKMAHDGFGEKDRVGYQMCPHICGLSTCGADENTTDCKRCIRPWSNARERSPGNTRVLLLRVRCARQSLRLETKEASMCYIPTTFSSCALRVYTTLAIFLFFLATAQRTISTSASKK